MHKEYNYDIDTKQLISISLQGEPQVEANGKTIIYNKRTPDARFIERYIEHENGFASTDQEWNINHTYNREKGEFEYGCNVKYIRNDGRVYYAQNGTIQVNLLPNSERIQELIDFHSDKKIVELIYVEKDVGTQIYIITKE